MFSKINFISIDANTQVLICTYSYKYMHLPVQKYLHGRWGGGSDTPSPLQIQHWTPPLQQTKNLKELLQPPLRKFEPPQRIYIYTYNSIMSLIFLCILHIYSPKFVLFMIKEKRGENVNFYDVSKSYIGLLKGYCNIGFYKHKYKVMVMNYCLSKM